MREVMQAEPIQAVAIWMATMSFGFSVVVATVMMFVKKDIDQLWEELDRMKGEDSV